MFKFSFLVASFLLFLSPDDRPKKLSPAMEKAQSDRKINVKQTLCKPNQRKKQAQPHAKKVAESKS